MPEFTIPVKLPLLLVNPLTIFPEMFNVPGEDKFWMPAKVAPFNAVQFTTLLLLIFMVAVPNATIPELRMPMILLPATRSEVMLIVL